MAAAAATSSSETKKSARLAMMELANMLSVPMALNAVVRLGVPNILSQSPHPLSPSQILALANLDHSPSAATNLQRLLRLLTSHHVFAEHISVDDSIRRYNLTEIGTTLVDDADGNSFAPYVLQHHQEALVKAWPVVHEAVVDPAGPEPFAKANGLPAYQFYGKDEEANELMRKAMWGLSVPFMEAFLDGYRDHDFAGVETLVDVGGSSGACLSMIMRRVESVKVGVNFDMPEVVAGAPDFPGIIHVGGDMFKYIPQGDAIFMKWVLTTWTDEECELILKNCYNSLPEGGKVIACEPVVPEETDSSQRTRALLEGDIFVMTIYRAQGKERTEEEFKKIGIAAGFPGFRAMYLDHFYTVLEFQK